MALNALLMGPSGAGKSTSIQGFQPTEAGVLAVEKPRLPFKSDIKVVQVPEVFPDARTMAQMHRAQYEWILRAIQTARYKSLVIDDSQYLLTNELIDRANERGYDKFIDIAKNFRDLVHGISRIPEDDKIVYFLHHSEIDADGRAKAKTIGRMLDEKLCLEGMFDIVLYCQDKKFYTQANGMSSAKSPMGMFDSIEIENNLKLVDTAIRTYYDM